MTIQQRILVTGASRGIGKAIALKLAEQGFAITVHYRANQDLAEQVVAQIQAAGGQADSLAFDVSQREQTASVLAEAVNEYGAYYGVICNAGIARDNAFPALTAEDWDGVIHTNLDAFYNVLQPLIMPMIRLRQGGRIITLTSVSGIVGNRGQVNYSAAKSGLIGATKALAVELAKRNITVNSVAPGVITTDMIDALHRDEILQVIPMRRFGEPEEVAAIVGFLCSPAAGYITRQVISINGGMC